ncbi:MULTISPECIES: hypothetical protein [Cellulomonas]|uniref:hypothetical protein n=1 Tax=Cellulomonas TaxID=1707 RepID=UPI0010A7DFBB|nr:MULTISPECIES: hypothetical protein [Cellulomonas]
MTEDVVKQAVELDAFPPEQRARSIAAIHDLVRFATEWPAFEAQYGIPLATAGRASGKPSKSGA